jgi:hypothetical protein
VLPFVDMAAFPWGLFISQHQAEYEQSTVACLRPVRTRRDDQPLDDLSYADGVADHRFQRGENHTFSFKWITDAIEMRGASDQRRSRYTRTSAGAHLRAVAHGHGHRLHGRNDQVHSGQQAVS